MYIVLMKRRGQINWEPVYSGKHGPLFTDRLEAEIIYQEMVNWFPTTRYTIGFISTLPA